MKIDSIGVRIPTRIVTNDEVLDLIAQHSTEASVLLVKTYQRIVRGLLSAAGSQTRHIRDEEKGEKASTFIIGAISDALEKASLEPKDIDLLIYCGVGKGFLEPANAYFYAQKLGMHASCFDIVDACMSWIRALEVSYEFFKSGRYTHIMIANGEFNMHHGFTDNMKIRDLRQVAYTFPTYTIGEAASATILSASDCEWRFKYKSLPDL